MADDNTITVESIQETEYGEKAIIDSPFEAKDAIKHLPWKAYGEEIEEHGSLKKKAESRGTNTKTSELVEVFDAMEKYGFDKNFATHVSWNPDALDGEGAWTIDAEAVPEAVDFWRFLGYQTSVAEGVDI